MKTKGKMKKLLCLLATVSMLVSLLPAAALAADDPALTATAMANGVQLSWSAADFAGATEYTLYRDDAPLATVNASNSNASVSDGTWTYNDVYFQTLEQMLGELSGADSAKVDENHTYCVKAGATTSATATAKPDTSKIAYYTFSNATGFTSGLDLNGGTQSNWSDIKKTGLQIDSPKAYATKGDTAASITLTKNSDTATVTTKYSAESATHRKTIYVDNTDGKKAARLVAVPSGSNGYATGFGLTVNATTFTDETAQDYTFWINASLLGMSGEYSDYGCFGVDGSSTSGYKEVCADKDGVDIKPADWYGEHLTNSTFSYVVPDTASGADRYATYKFKTNKVLNNKAGTRTLSLYAPSGSNSVAYDHAKKYNADGEAAAIHSVAVMKTADYLPPNEEVVDTTDAEAKLEAAKEALTITRVNETSDIPLDTVGTNGTKISWSSSNTAAVGNDGKVYPRVGEAQSATLTATITLDGYSGSKTKTFTVNVPAVMDYAIDGVKLTKDGDSVIDTALVAGKTLKTISVRRYSESTTSLKAIIALYKGGTLVNVVSEDVSAASIAKYAYGDITLTTGLTLPDIIDDSYSVKIYLTNSKLTPLAMSYTVTPAPTAGITVYMAGDSTMQTYADKYFPLQGWGNELGSFLQTDAVTVDNTQSMGGRSTKYFIAEGRLNTIKQKIKAGDYLFVQFGHNDGKYTAGQADQTCNGKLINIHTSIGSYQTVDAAKVLDGDNTSYFAYLENFVDVAKNAGANVVLFTSFNRAHADENNLQGYPEAMRAFAAARNIPIVDTTDLSVKLYNAALTEGESKVTAGAVDSKENFAKNLFLYANANDPRYTSDSRYTSSENNTQKRDSTHFNIYGAQARAELAAAALREAGIPLGRYVTVTDGTENVITDIITNIPTPYYGSTENPAS